MSTSSSRRLRRWSSPRDRRPKPFPIVFSNHADPVGTGHVASLPRPGRNITGLSMLLTDLVAKELEILAQAIIARDPDRGSVDSDDTLSPARLAGSRDRWRKARSPARRSARANRRRLRGSILNNVASRGRGSFGRSVAALHHSTRTSGRA